MVLVLINNAYSKRDYVCIKLMIRNYNTFLYSPVYAANCPPSFLFQNLSIVQLFVLKAERFIFDYKKYCFVVIVSINEIGWMNVN